MVQYDFLELLKAVRTCIEKPRFRVGVFVKSFAAAKRDCSETFDTIKQDEEEFLMVDGYIDRSSDQFISFSNGSYIKFVNAVANNTRGHRFNEILYADDLDQDDICCLKTLETRYMEEKHGTSR